MVRTIQEYEASDIDLGDPVHRFIMATYIYLLVSKPESKDDATEEFVKARVADVLNLAAASGITITTAELPRLFR